MEPRLFKQVKVDAVLKQGNSGDVSADQISLFEKITLHRMENIIDQNTPRGQGGIKCGLSRCGQVLFLITMMECGFQRMEKTEGAFLTSQQHTSQFGDMAFYQSFQKLYLVEDW